MSDLAERMKKLLDYYPSSDHERAEFQAIVAEVRELEQRLGIAERAVECADGSLTVPAIDAFCKSLPESQHATFNSLIAAAREVGRMQERVAKLAQKPDAGQAGVEAVLHQIRFHPEDPRTDWQNCHPETFAHFVSDPDYATRELTVRQTVPHEVMMAFEDAAHRVRHVTQADSRVGADLATVRDWLRSVSA